MKTLEEMTKQRFDVGRGSSGVPPATQYRQAVYYRMEAEIWLNEEKAR